MIVQGCEILVPLLEMEREAHLFQVTLHASCLSMSDRSLREMPFEIDVVMANQVQML